MTNWMPEKLSGVGPVYVQLADKIETDIDQGRLKAGDKLPPQRNLAYDIGVTVGTIGRAYNLCIERGLVSGEIGRGTYVLEQESRASHQLISLPKSKDEPLRGMGEAEGYLRMNSTSVYDFGQSDIISKVLGDIIAEHPEKAVDYIRSLDQSWQKAGQEWLSFGGWIPEQDCIVPTLGVHSAILSIIATITSPGDKVAFEELTYASLARSVQLIGRRVVFVKMNENGLDPDDFGSVCSQQHPKVLVTIPSLHNPTLAIMSEDVRKQVSDIAHKNNVFIIEDNIYGASLDDQPMPIAAMAPDRVFHIGGLSKSVAAGVRGGWAYCPKRFLNQILIAHKMLSGGHSYLLAEIAARLVLSGDAAHIRKVYKEELKVRFAIISDLLKEFHLTSHINASYVWLQVPEPWFPGTFKTAAREQNILIDHADEFKITQTQQTLHRCRITFAALKTSEQVRQAATTLKQILISGAVGYDSYS